MRLGEINIDYRGEVLDELSGRVVVEDGRPRLEPLPGTAARWRVILDRHAGRGPLRVVLSRVNERRSAAQNRLLWKVYTDVLGALRERAADIGERCPFPDEEALHEAMKFLFIGATVNRFDGREYEIPPTSTTLDTAQFSRFVNAIAAYWAERGIYVELPEAS
ncbi:MAG TPA: hypothetical protein VJT67_07260 [Longimicrobiaceae bacterium]|nr:hypothetical protein [Longimicrobiaceae bacterium]